MFAGCKNLKCALIAGVTIVSLFSISWQANYKEAYWMWVQRLLLQSYNEATPGILKKWDLAVTPEGFFRLKKYYTSGKQEYFSLNFKHLKAIEYDGIPASGEVVFKTIEDDIIVQTYNDPNGNLDSMATILKLPVINMEPLKLDTLRQTLLNFAPSRN